MPDPNPNPNPNPNPGGGDNTPAPWFSDTQKDYVANKGWKTPVEAVDSFINIEKLIGADKAGRTVVLPKDDKDAEGTKAFRAKLGVPEKAENYELPVPEGDSGDFAKIVAGVFHQHGIPKAAGQAIAKWWNEFFGKEQEGYETAARTASETALTALKGEWGNDFDKRSEFGRRALRAFGTKSKLDDNDLRNLESSLGTAKMLKLFSTIGESLKEDTFVGGEDKQFGQTKAQAQAKLDDMRIRRAKGEINDTQWRELEAERDRLGAAAAAGA